MKQKLTPKLTYKLCLSLQMKMFLNLLQLPLVKLKDYIYMENDKNHVIELSEQKNEFSRMEEPADYAIAADDTLSKEETKKKRCRESLMATLTALKEHLLRQLNLFTENEEDLKIGRYILGSLILCPR